MSDADDPIRRSTDEKQRGLDEARQGIYNPPHDVDGRQAYDAGRDIHAEEERRRTYADSVAHGAASLYGEQRPRSATDSVAQGTTTFYEDQRPLTDAEALARGDAAMANYARMVRGTGSKTRPYDVLMSIALLVVVAAFALVVYGLLALPLNLLRVPLPSWSWIVGTGLVIGVFCALIYLPAFRAFSQRGVPAVVTLYISAASAASVIGEGISTTGATNWLVATVAAGVVSFGLSWLVYRWLNEVKPL